MIDSRVTDPTLLHRARARDDGPGGVRGCLCADVVGTSRGGKTSQHAASQVTQRKPHRRAKMNSSPVSPRRRKTFTGRAAEAGTHDIAHARVARATRPAGRRAGRVAAARRRRVLVSGLSASSPRAPDRRPACYRRARTRERLTLEVQAWPPNRRSDGRRNTSRGPTRSTEYDTVCACRNAPVPISSASAAAAAVICARTERRCAVVSRPLLPPRH